MYRKIYSILPYVKQAFPCLLWACFAMRTPRNLTGQITWVKNRGRKISLDKSDTSMTSLCILLSTLSVQWLLKLCFLRTERCVSVVFFDLSLVSLQKNLLSLKDLWPFLLISMCVFIFVKNLNERKLMKKAKET